MSERILLVEDDARLAEMLCEYLGGAGFRVVLAPFGTTAMERLAGSPYDAVILDLMLPDMDGLDVCRQLRAKSDTPLLMLTARGDATDRIVGLELGADDYLPKPFEPRELLARLRAILRRRGAGASTERVLRFGRLEIDLAARALSIDGDQKTITSYQYELLVAFAKNAGRVLSRETLMDLVKGEQLEAFDRSIDVHISRIRAAIEDDPKQPRRIITLRGAGYVFAKARIDVSRLHVSFHLALLGSLLAFAVISGVFWHLGGRETVGHSIYAVIMAFLLLALVVGAVAYPLARRLTKRLERLQRGVESLGAGDLSARVPVEGRDEVASLAASFNRAAERIEALVGAHKTLLANASHELRTPLARIRMATELMKESADPKRKAGLDQDIAELDFLIDEILLASRLDAVAELDTSEEVDLLPLAAEECARYVNVQLDGESVLVHGDPRLLRRLLRNLLENARRHGRPPTQVRIGNVQGQAQIVVIDQGAAIPAEQCARLFEPFYRRAGGNNNVGTGLGLALVRQIAGHHRGEVEFAATSENRNSFVVTLPVRVGAR